MFTFGHLRVVCIDMLLNYISNIACDFMVLGIYNVDMVVKFTEESHYTKRNSYLPNTIYQTVIP